MHIFTAIHPLDVQFLYKRVLYLRWQQRSHSPGLIYLRDRIMNSLWHLIWPSLLIWVSARIWGLIRAASTSRLSHPPPRYASKWLTRAFQWEQRLAAGTPSPPKNLHVLPRNLECSCTSQFGDCALPWFFKFFFFIFLASTICAGHTT